MVRARLRPGLFLAVLVALLGGCDASFSPTWDAAPTQPGPADTGEPAPPDSAQGPSDAGADAELDGAVDAAVDAASDASMDGGALPDGGETQVPGFICQVSCADGGEAGTCTPRCTVPCKELMCQPEEPCEADGPCTVRCSACAMTIK
jgi:hypothetical protein